MKITDVYVTNAHISIFFGSGEFNSQGYESGSELEVGKTGEFINFSYKQEAYRRKNKTPLEGVRLVTSDSLIGKDVSFIGVSGEENLVFIFAGTGGERLNCKLSLSLTNRDSGQSSISYSIIEVKDNSGMIVILDGRGYMPRRINIPDPEISLLFGNLKNERQFQEASRGLKKLLGADGDFYRSDYCDQNHLRISLDNDPKDAYRQLFSLLSVLCERKGNWLSLLMWESPKDSKESAPFSMINKALKEILDELVSVGLATRKDPTLTMMRWLVTPPRNIEGESQNHEVMISDFVIAKSE